MIGYVHEFVHLIAYRSGVFGVVISEYVGRYARNEIDVLVAVYVVQAVAFAALDGDIVARENGHVVRRFGFFDFIEIHYSPLIVFFDHSSHAVVGKQFQKYGVGKRAVKYEYAVYAAFDCVYTAFGLGTMPPETDPSSIICATPTR